ncbi:MAG: hypothetical protein ACOYOP_03860 [Microthrixaceae bacterium]
MGVPLLAAEVQYSTLLRSLVLALLVVAPFFWYQWRKVRRARAEAAAAAAPTPETAADPRPRLEDVVGSIAATVTTTEVTVPDGVTVDGVEVAPDMVELLVADALRRSGLVEVERTRRGDATVLRCAPAADGAP